MNVKDFIKQHTHDNYCEAIIYPNGDIEYAERGHVNKLVEASNKSKAEINKLMPYNASPTQGKQRWSGPSGHREQRTKCSETHLECRRWSQRRQSLLHILNTSLHIVSRC